MKTRRVLPVLAGLLGLAASSAAAQSLELREYSVQERWERAALHVTLFNVMMLRDALEAGKTVPEYTREVVAVIGPGWQGVTTPAAMARAMHRNWNVWPGATFSAEELEDGSVRIRANRPWEAAFGEAGAIYGVSLEDADTSFRIFHELIAAQQRMDFRLTRVDDGFEIEIHSR